MPGGIMQIQQSGLTYSRIPEKAREVQQSELNTHQKPFSKIDKTEQTELSKTSTDKKLDEVQLSSASATVLTADERAMLNRLFPPSGRDVMLKAYRQVKNSDIKNQGSLGQKIDLKT
jgi:hypothetical protein